MYLKSEFSNLGKLLLFCNKYYSKKKMSHALRVANYAAEKANEKNYNIFTAYMIGLAHDLLEDTDCDQEELCDIIGDEAFDVVLTLSKADDVSYEEYIQDILQCNDEFAFIVKQADLKDHFTLTDTLTDKLKEKYVPILQYFL